MPNSPINTSQFSCTGEYSSHENPPQGPSLQSVAMDLISDHGLENLDGGRIRLILEAALNVEYLLFLAALEEPSAHELESIAEDFIRRAMTPSGSVQ